VSGPPVLQVTNVRKAYGGLRPLRLNELTIAKGERVAVSGLDAASAEVLVNLVTGASIPDEGDIRVAGQSTAALEDGDAWLTSLDRFGIVSPRAVLLDSVSLVQNLAMPFSLEIDPIPPDILERARSLAAAVAIHAADLDRPVAALDPGVRMRAHLARALALDPVLLVLEHPTASLPPGLARSLGETVARAAADRRLATLIISEDGGFTGAAAARRLTLNGATGDLRPARRSWLPFR
jgi:ABC-type transporter Mla maintaining outer membrane lipid asymmetry ATPase subunit MlaF